MNFTTLMYRFDNIIVEAGKEYKDYTVTCNKVAGVPLIIIKDADGVVEAIDLRT